MLLGTVVALALISGTSVNLEDQTPELGDKAVIVFQSPRDIHGTALLTHSKVEPDDDDQWLYLPAVKQVKRISSSNRTGKFVSSEFSFEDLGSQEVGMNVRVIEAGDGVGGTWYWNRYPGARCDSESHVYSFTLSYGESW